MLADMSQSIKVMRAFKIAFLAAGVGVMLAIGIVAAWLVLAWRHPPSSVPVASISLLGYSKVTLSNRNLKASPYPWGEEWIEAKMNLKNEGKASISYHAWGDEPYGWAKAQTPKGLTNGYLAPPFTGGIIVLQPGSNRVFWVDLPASTSRWECGFSVEEPSVRERVVWKMLRSGILIWLGKHCEWVLDLLPDKEGPEAEVKSGSLEIDKNTGITPHS